MVAGEGLATVSKVLYATDEDKHAVLSATSEAQARLAEGTTQQFATLQAQQAHLEAQQASMQVSKPPEIRY